MATLDLAELAAMHPRADELITRITSGDVSACWDAEVFFDEVNRMSADAHTFVAHCETRFAVHAPGTDADFADSTASDADDGLHSLVGFISGSYVLQAAVDDARDADEPDDD